MIVVADTSPLNYLIRLELIELLPRLYVDIWIPEVVRLELLHARAPKAVSIWSQDLPSWVHVRVPRDVRIDAGDDLDPGELEAMALAHEMSAELVLMDDQDGRKVAEKRGLIVVGTLSVLGIAAERGLLDFRESVGRLRAMGFHASNEVIQVIADRIPSR